MKTDTNYALRVMFVCHGNICRSPMAEFLFKDMLNKRGLSGCVAVASCGTSAEECGNPVHYGTKRILSGLGIDTSGKYAARLNASDYNKYDWFLGMDSANIRNMVRLFAGDPSNKVRRLLDFTSSPRDVLDPWYTGDFDLAYKDILEGLNAFFASEISGKLC